MVRSAMLVLAGALLACAGMLAACERVASRPAPIILDSPLRYTNHPRNANPTTNPHNVNNQNLNPGRRNATRAARNKRTMFGPGNEDEREADVGALNMYLTVRCSIGDIMRACVVDVIELVNDADL